jgi:GGDEF domain-containing protein
MGGDVCAHIRHTLTGLLNRRAFRRATVNLITRHRGAADAYLTIIMIDLDGFNGSTTPGATRPVMKR